MALTLQPISIRGVADAEILAEEAGRIMDIDGHKAWASGPLQKVLPHQALLAAQLTTHSGGYTTLKSWSNGVPKPYRIAISRPGHNVRSPIFERLLRTDRDPQFFDASEDGRSVNADWLRSFKLANWHNLLMLSHAEQHGEDTLLTVASFYNVRLEAASFAAQLQHAVMPPFHAAFVRINTVNEVSVNISAFSTQLTPAEQAIAALLARGQTNKQIATALCKSDQTIKTQLSVLMRKLNTKNRAETVAILVAHALLPTNCK